MDTRKIKIENECYEIASNCDIAIYVDGICNADCRFCIAQMRYGNRSDMFKKPRIIDKAKYVKRTDELLALLKPLDLSVSLTGGEPTQSERLIDIVALLAKHNVRRRSISTNGSGLLHKLKGGQRCIDVLLDGGVNIFNISRQHHDEEKNNYLMNYLYEPCTNDMLQDIIQYVVSHGAVVRMSGSVMKGGVDNVDELMGYIEFYEKMGCKDYRFRELMKYADGSTINEQKMAFCQEHHVPMQQILNQINSVSAFKNISKTVDTAIYTYRAFEYLNSTLLVQVENKEQEIQSQKNNDHILCGLIIHQNGDLATSWADATKILSRYEER